MGRSRPNDDLSQLPLDPRRVLESCARSLEPRTPKPCNSAQLPEAFPTGDVIGMSDGKKRRRRLLAAALAQGRAAEKEIIEHDRRKDDQLTERVAHQIGTVVRT